MRGCVMCALRGIGLQVIRRNRPIAYTQHTKIHAGVYALASLVPIHMLSFRYRTIQPLSIVPVKVSAYGKRMGD